MRSMNWEIYEGEEPVNTIYGKEGFVKAYCEKNGYTYRPREDPPPEPEPPSEAETLRAGIAGVEDAVCEQDAAFEARLAEIENALCELDKA